MTGTLSVVEEALEGTTLGRYRVGRKLGAGGMGAVHAGVQEPLGRPVAIKVLRREVAENADVAARFKREAEVAATLSHPNIAQVTDFGVEQGRAYLVMELLEGESLAALLGREGALSEARVQRLGMQILAGLAVAHERGIVHRDLKPENLFVQQVGSMELVKILDFGIARLVDADHAVTHTGAVLGTPAYMSPEQARGKRVDARSDVFSLGGVLYEMLSGRRPFAAENYHELMFAVVEERPTPLAEIDPAITPALAELVARAMGKAPDERFPSAREMSEALSALEGLRERAAVPGRALTPVRNESAEALAPTMASEPDAERSSPRPRGSRAWPAVAAMTLAALALGGWAALSIPRTPDARTGGVAGSSVASGGGAADAGSPPILIAAPTPDAAPTLTPIPTSEPTRRALAEAVSPVSPDEPLPLVPPPAEHRSHAAATGTVRMRCGESGTETELAIVGPRNHVTIASFVPLGTVPRGSSSPLVTAANAQASTALTTCYRGHPILGGQDYDLDIAPDGTVQRVAAHVYCPIDPRVDACVRRAFGEVVFPNAAAASMSVRLGLTIER